MQFTREKLEVMLKNLDLNVLGEPVDFCHVDGYRRWEFSDGDRKIIISVWADGRRTICLHTRKKMISAGCIVK